MQALEKRIRQLKLLTCSGELERSNIQRTTGLTCVFDLFPERKMSQHRLFPGSRSEKLKQYEELFETAPESVLKFLKITKSEAEDNRESSEKEEKVSDEGEEGGAGEGEKGEQGGRRMSRGGVVLSSREKPLEELPNLAARARAKVHQLF